MKCYYIKKYYVRLTKWKPFPEGGGRNFECTHLLGRARYLNSKLKVNERQIDVRVRGKSGASVLSGSYC